MRTIMKNTLKLFMALIFVFTLAHSANALMINELSGNVLLDPPTGTGAGTEGDPILIYETIIGPGSVDLHIADIGVGDLGDGVSVWGRWFRKVVTNMTGSAWTSFEIELHEELGTPSSDGDGLSFAQGRPVRPFSSDFLPDWTEIFLPKDFVNFYGGSVAHGATVAFDFYVTHQAPSDFFIRQSPNEPVPGVVPEPSTYILLGSGFAALAYYRRRKTRS